MTYGSEVVSSGLMCLGSMFCDAQTTACPMVMPRKFSQPTVSLCGSWKASFVTMRIGPLPAFTSSRKAWLRRHVGTGWRSM